MARRKKQTKWSPLGEFMTSEVTGAIETSKQMASGVFEIPAVRPDRYKQQRPGALPLLMGKSPWGKFVKGLKVAKKLVHIVPASQKYANKNMFWNGSYKLRGDGGLFDDEKWWVFAGNKLQTGVDENATPERVMSMPLPQHGNLRLLHPRITIRNQNEIRKTNHTPSYNQQIREMMHRPGFDISFFPPPEQPELLLGDVDFGGFYGATQKTIKAGMDIGWIPGRPVFKPGERENLERGNVWLQENPRYESVVTPPAAGNISAYTTAPLKTSIAKKELKTLEPEYKEKVVGYITETRMNDVTGILDDMRAWAERNKGEQQPFDAPVVQSVIARVNDITRVDDTTLEEDVYAPKKKQKEPAALVIARARENHRKIMRAEEERRKQLEIEKLMEKKQIQQTESEEDLVRKNNVKRRAQRRVAYEQGNN